MGIKQDPKTGQYLADFIVEGRRIRSKGSTAEIAAENCERRLRNILSEDKLVKKSLANKPKNSDSFTFGEAIRNSEEIRWQDLKSCKTALGYARTVVNYFGRHTAIDTITRKDIIEMRRYFLKKKTKPNKPSTVNYKVSTIRSMLKDAVEMEKIEPPDFDTLFPASLPENNIKNRVFSREEEKQFVEYFFAIGKPKAAHFFTFLIETGCRFTEGATVKARDIDIRRRRLHIPETKNGYPRTMPLTSTAIQAVKPFVPDHHPDASVWGYEYKEFQHIFDGGRAALGLAQDKLLTLHCTRHTFATRLTAKGVSLVQLMQWGGWKSLKAVQRYAHVDITSLERIAEEIDQGCGRMCRSIGSIINNDRNDIEEVEWPV